MTIEDQIAALETENAQMRRSVPLLPTNRSQKGQKRPVITGTSAIFNALKDKPGFKAFCARGRGWPKAIGMKERLDRAQKATNSQIRSALKPKGIWSIMKENPYTTGRLIRYHYGPVDGADWGSPLDQEAKLVKISRDEWTSEICGPKDRIAQTVPQTIPRFGLDAQFKPEQEDPVISAAGPISDDQDMALVIEALEAQNALLAKLAARRAA